jgi:hypothetical protein
MEREADGLMALRVLNLGAGHAIIGHALNVDVARHRPEIDLVVDLNETPWPWDDDSWDQVVAKAVFEHLKLTLFESMEELWRIVAPGGFAEIKLPYWNAEVSYDDPSHRYQVGLGVFDQFDPSTDRGRYYCFYTRHKWRKRRVFLNQGGTSVYAVLDVIKPAWPDPEVIWRAEAARAAAEAMAEGADVETEPRSG